MKHNYLLIDNDKYKDEYALYGLMSSDFNVYYEDVAGDKQFNRTSQTMQAYVSGKKYKQKTVNYELLSSDVAIQAYLVTNDVVFLRERSQDAALQSFIKMAPTLNPIGLTYAGNGNYVFQEPVQTRIVGGAGYIQRGETCSFENDAVRLDGSERYCVVQINMQQPVGNSVKYKVLLDSESVSDKLEILAIEIVQSGFVFDDGGNNA